jgi:predicted class III extradiol MEMO1 family dioxygenase
MVKACQVLKAALKSVNNNNVGGGENKPKTFLFLGTDHSSFTSKDPLIYLSSQTWRTPLGDFERDDDLYRCFVESGMAPIDDYAHMREHSIENMIPFLQYFFADDNDLQMVAINCRYQANNNCNNHIINNNNNNNNAGAKVYRDQGHRIAKIVRDYLHTTNQARTLIIMATTDYTHAGPWYGELPQNVGQTIPDYIRNQDEPVLRAIRQLSPKTTYTTGRKTSMCGLGTTLVTMKIAQDFGKHRAVQLQYAVGSDICNRGVEDQTGFASFVFV